MPTFCFLALLPFGEHDPAAFVSQIDGAALLCDEIFCSNLSAINKSESEPVGQSGTQFFHKVESEARASRAIPMQKAHGRVETDALRSAAAIVRQKRIKEREERVHGIKRRPARAPTKGELGLGHPDQIIEDTEINVTGFPLGAAEEFSAVVRER